MGFDFPLRLRADRPDLLHVQYTGPIACRVPLVVTVHDVSYLEYPQYFTRFRSIQLRLTVKRTVEAAARVLTPSEYSRDAILRHYELDPQKLWWCRTPHLRFSGPSSATWQRPRWSGNFKFARPSCSWSGDLQPRKNHLGLLRAFENVTRAHPHLPHRLVFVGKETWYSKELHRAVASSSIADRVDFTGFVEDAELVHFYGACDLFVFPSFYEGFGLPILEAMACGRAVACSNVTAMPEVADGAGILFDPHSIDEIARAIADVLLDCELRQRLERLGIQRASQFSWEQAARRTLQVYYEVAGAGRRLTAGGSACRAESSCQFMKYFDSRYS